MIFIRFTLSRIILLGSILLLSTITVKAQNQDNIIQDSFAPSFGISGSYSPNSFKGWGTMQNTRQMYLTLNYRHSGIHLGSMNLSLVSEVIVTGFIRYPNDGMNGPKESVAGLGLIPIRLHVPLTNKLNTPFLTSSAGFLVFGNEFPSAIGTRFNYTLDAGIGYHYQLKNGNSIQFGYKIGHLSNGNTGEQNPGIDSQHLFFEVLFNLN